MKLLKRFSGDDVPFFLYVSFNAPHWPLHAREEDIAAYEGDLSCRMGRNKKNEDIKSS